MTKKKIVDFENTMKAIAGVCDCRWADEKYQFEKERSRVYLKIICTQRTCEYYSIIEAT